MKNRQIIILYLSIIFIGCSSKKNTILPLKTSTEDVEYIKESIDEDTFKINTTNFYQIVKSFDLKNNFKLNERKSFNVRIVNYGHKELYVPEWLNTYDGEIKIELYRKNKKGKYLKYKQLSKVTTTNILPKNNPQREILSSKNGELIVLKNIELDKYLKIVDTGMYYAIIYIDLSNFGYFKTLIGETRRFSVTD